MVPSNFPAPSPWRPGGNKDKAGWFRRPQQRGSEEKKTEATVFDREKRVVLQ
jgi:hypothetical protein